MSMFNDITWKKDDQNCISNAEKVKDYAKKFKPGHWIFLRPGSETRWYGDSHSGQWDRTANRMVQQFKETGHPIFINTSALSHGVLKRRNGKGTILQWWFYQYGTLVSNNSFRESDQYLYAAITDWCYQFVLTNEKKERVAVSVDNGLLTMMEPE